MSFLLFSNWFPIWFLSTSCIRLSLSQSCCAEMFRHKNVDSGGDLGFWSVCTVALFVFQAIVENVVVAFCSPRDIVFCVVVEV